MIPYGKQLISEADAAAVAETVRNGVLTSGPLIERFEADLCAATGASHAIVCASATAALHLCCLAMGITKGTLGVTSPITFLASANCIEYCGGTTDFIDIDPQTLCLSPTALRAYCEEVRVPDVVIPVDFAGVPCDLEALLELKRKYKFLLIEDCAHGIGGTYEVNGKQYQSGCGIHADCTVFSFHPVKTVTTGEGGAVLTNDAALAARIRTFRSHGMVKDQATMEREGPWYYEMHQLGFHYRITDMQCALGISQLTRLKEFKGRRQQLVSRYTEAFSKDDHIITPPWPKTTSPCFHLYPIQLRSGAASRKQLYGSLLAMGIQTQVHYIPVYWQPYYREKYRYAVGKCPEAEKYYQRCLSIPLFAGLTDEEQKMVINAVLSGVSQIRSEQ